MNASYVTIAHTNGYPRLICHDQPQEQFATAVWENGNNILALTTVVRANQDGGRIPGPVIYVVPSHIVLIEPAEQEIVNELRGRTPPRSREHDQAASL